MHAAIMHAVKLTAAPLILPKTKIKETTTSKCSGKDLDWETVVRPQSQRLVYQYQTESPAYSTA